MHTITTPQGVIAIQHARVQYKCKVLYYLLSLNTYHYFNIELHSKSFVSLYQKNETYNTCTTSIKYKCKCTVLLTLLNTYHYVINNNKYTTEGDETDILKQLKDINTLCAFVYLTWVNKGLHMLSYLPISKDSCKHERIILLNFNQHLSLCNFMKTRYQNNTAQTVHKRKRRVMHNYNYAVLIY